MSAQSLFHPPAHAERDTGGAERIGPSMLRVLCQNDREDANYRDEDAFVYDKGPGITVAMS